MLGTIFSFLIGIIAGTLTGLTPGIHTNLIATSIISIPILLKLPTSYFLIFITATSITHTFLNFIPSIFLGAPDSDTCLGILPGHKFLLKGHGHHATKLTLTGSVIAIISLIIIIPIFFFIIPKIYPIIKQMMGFILIWISIFLLLNESNKTTSILIFLLAGFLGMSTFNLNLPNPLLPLLTGLFGTSTIIHSIKTKSIPPKQIIENFSIKKSKLIKPTLATILISPICSLLPGLGSSQAAIISSSIFKKLNNEQFMILLGSINTLIMSTSFLTLYLFQKTRTGTAAAISQILNISSRNLITILITIILTSLLAIPLTLFSSKTIAKQIHKINYTKISYTILIFLILITIYFTGILGLLVLIVSTLLGLTCIELETKRNLLMASILIPTIIFYLPF
ncbi:tripartite tricarboxylate transporter permease [Candidatus Pacearchaeota archaeon]|nr:tripartite tricarboxylate transporter permease [Candidatus Pacearchaeota archaeon]